MNWRAILSQSRQQKVEVVEKPEVVLLGLAIPVDSEGMRAYEENAKTPEQLIEITGRTCYQSFTRITPESASKMIHSLIDSGHESVIEHSYAIFRISGGSRAFTHQLVRHRLMAISQQSQRYCDEGDYRVIIPSSIESHRTARALFIGLIKLTKTIYSIFKSLGIKNEDARFILPNAVESEIVISANFRELRHIFQERCVLVAQWEIRGIALQMLRIMKQIAPTVFGDFVVNEEKNFAFILPLTCEQAQRIADGGIRWTEKSYRKMLEHIAQCSDGRCRNLKQRFDSLFLRGAG